MDGPRTLVLETSGRTGQVALCAPGEVASRVLAADRRHARDLVPAVRDLLVEAGWTPADLQLVVVGVGPGSFTSLRVGLAAAKALAYATGAALVGVETFAALALDAAEAYPDATMAIEVVADAQQGGLYAQSFTRTADGVRVIGPVVAMPAAEWARRLQAGTLVTGPGLPKVSASLPAGVPLHQPQGPSPRWQSLAELGLARWRAGERDDPRALEPLYVRASAPEERA